MSMTTHDIERITGSVAYQNLNIRELMRYAKPETELELALYKALEAIEQSYPNLKEFTK